MSQTRVLFLCTGNSSRSQMAEAFLRKYAGERFEAHSAGLEPKSIALREKVVMMLYAQYRTPSSFDTVESGGKYISFAKRNRPQMKENFRLLFEPDVQPIPRMSSPPQDFETGQKYNKEMVAWKLASSP